MAVHHVRVTPSGSLLTCKLSSGFAVLPLRRTRDFVGHVQRFGAFEGGQARGGKRPHVGEFECRTGTGTTTAETLSPIDSSSRPMTATSEIWGCSKSTASTSAQYTFSPPRMTTSLSRSTT